MEILIIVLLFYFIQNQVGYSKITRMRYYFIPLFSLFQVFNVFTLTRRNIVVLLICIAVGLAVGCFQAKYATIKRQNVPYYFYYDENHSEHNVYKKQVLVRGGHKYILGWIIIFAVQIFLQYQFVSQKIDIQKGLFDDLLSDIFSVYRIQDIEDKSSGWYAWALYGFSSLFYYFALCKKFPVIREILLHSDGETVD